jgi:hypothetical protein
LSQSSRTSNHPRCGARPRAIVMVMKRAVNPLK